MKIKFSKLSAVALAALIAACCFACTPSADEIRVYMPDGAPAIALSKFMHEGYADTVFTVVPNGEILRARVASGDADLAIMPINAAAALEVLDVLPLRAFVPIDPSARISPSHLSPIHHWAACCHF